MKRPTDEDLVAGVLEGDEVALEALFDRYAEALQRHACHIVHDAAAARDVVTGAAVIVRHGYVDGYTPEELFACVSFARRGFAGIFLRWEQMGKTFRTRNVSTSFNVLTRALRSNQPGVVFARAATLEERDPLTDVEARLLVGLPVV